MDHEQSLWLLRVSISSGYKRGLFKPGNKCHKLTHNGALISTVLFYITKIIL